MKAFRSLLPFISLVIAFLLVGLSVVMVFTKVEIHLGINAYHHHFFDVFFKYYTHVADGLTIVLMGIALLFIRMRYGLMMLLALLFSSAVTQSLKNFVFSDWLRPSRYFGKLEGIELHVVEGVELHCCHSFPSGHTTAGFALFITLAFVFFKNKRILQYICALLAILVGYSRVYLSQHHFEDILAGAAVGTACSFLIIRWLNSSEKSWLNRPIHKLRKKT